jgi:hypothetical protein
MPIVNSGCLEVNLDRIQLKKKICLTDQPPESKLRALQFLNRLRATPRLASRLRLFLSDFPRYDDALCVFPQHVLHVPQSLRKYLIAKACQGNSYSTKGHKNHKVN